MTTKKQKRILRGCNRSDLYCGEESQTIDRTNIVRGGMGESNERMRSILRGMGRSRNDSNKLMSYGYITQIDILSEIQNRD